MVGATRRTVQGCVSRQDFTSHCGGANNPAGAIHERPPGLRSIAFSHDRQRKKGNVEEEIVCGFPRKRAIGVGLPRSPRWRVPVHSQTLLLRADFALGTKPGWPQPRLALRGEI